MSRKHDDQQQQPAPETGFALLQQNEMLKTDHPVKNQYYTLLLCLKGKAQFTAGHHNFEIRPAHLSIIPAGTIFSIGKMSRNFHCLQILFTKDFLYKSHIREQIIEELLFIHPEYPPVFELTPEDYISIQAQYSAISDEMKSRRAFQFNILRLKLTELLYNYNRACEYCMLRFHKGMNRQYQLTWQFRQLVDKHVLQLHSINEYATKLGVTAKHLSETVKEETGKTALELIHNRLLLEMQYQLKHSAHSVKEIAAAFHFDNASHFSRFFRSKCGLTPLEYRSNP